jgi:hypothetical protein
LAHVTAQALIFLVLAVGVIWLFIPRMLPGLRIFFMVLLGVPGLLIWTGISGAHAILAGRTDVHFWSSCQSAQRATRRQGGKALLLLTSQVFLLAFAVLNLHFLIKAMLSLGEDFLGFSTARANLLLSLGNPVYGTALILVGWWLLSPFVEAVNYLFHLDCQVRYFGLDLWYRLDRFFPALPRGRAGAVLLAVGALLMAAGPAQAADRLTPLRAIRRELGTVIQEVEKTKPYRGGQRWTGQLDHMGNRLNEKVSTRPGGYNWFQQKLNGFQNLDQDQAVRVLQELDDRLSIVERSLRRQGGRSKEDIKKLVPDAEKTEPPPQIKEEEPEERPPPRRIRREEWNRPPPRTSGGGFEIGAGVAQALMWIVIIVVGVVGITALVILVVLNWKKWRKKKPPATSKKAETPAQPALEAVLTDPDEQNAAVLWGEADALARKGLFLEALRTLYLAVLVLLHRANLIRYERTRTNHEYARQLRPTPEVHKPFKGLTSLFELKWYGERSCQAADYDSCRGLAVNIQGEVEKE